MAVYAFLRFLFQFARWAKRIVCNTHKANCGLLGFRFQVGFLPNAYSARAATREKHSWCSFPFQYEFCPRLVARSCERETDSWASPCSLLKIGVFGFQLGFFLNSYFARTFKREMPSWVSHFSLGFCPRCVLQGASSGRRILGFPPLGI